MQQDQIPVPPQQNTPVQPQATSAPQGAPQSYKTTKLIYLTGMNRKNPENRHSAILDWSIDNRIRLYAVDEVTGEQTQMLDCAPQDIKRFSTGMGVANIIMRSGQRYTVEFSGEVASQIVGGAISSHFGLIGLVGATAMDARAVEAEAATDIAWWTDNLARFGVGGLQTPAKTLYKIDKVGLWVIGVMLGIVALFGLVALAIYLISAAGIA